MNLKAVHFFLIKSLHFLNAKIQTSLFQQILVLSLSFFAGRCILAAFLFGR